MQPGDRLITCPTFPTCKFIHYILLLCQLGNHCQLDLIAFQTVLISSQIDLSL